MRAGCGRFTIGLITPLAGLDDPMASDNLNYWSCRSHTQTRTRTLAAYHQLMLHTDTNEENLSGFLKLLDTALQHEVRRRPAARLVLLHGHLLLYQRLLCLKLCGEY